jgi:WD40 repeat protein/predicted Ser/Thr protein kinase
MKMAVPTHPRQEVLQAFALGKLSPDDASQVESHLTDCTECCVAVKDTPADRFVGLVRGARPRGKPSPAAMLPSDITAHPPHSSEASTIPPTQDCGGQVEPTPPLAAPPELLDHPRYRVLALLGQGGMGAVYKAEHRLMERCVALKTIGRDLSDRPGLVERFHREVKAAARLSHPNIVTAYDAERAGRTHFLVMEYVEGRDLSQLVKQRGALPVEEACEYVRQAAFGLQHAHERGMIHRDIKPHNLMVTPEGQVKILDFGLARFVREAGAQSGAVTLLGSVMGTPDYMAPEQASDSHQADIRADIYSLGCTLYHLLSGRVPFPKGSFFDKIMWHATDQPTPLHQLRPDLPPELIRVVERMMEKKPRRRYQTPAEVAQALAPFARGGPAPVAAASDPAAALFARIVSSEGDIVRLNQGGSRTHVAASGFRSQKRRKLGGILAVCVTVGCLVAGAALLGQIMIRVKTPTGTVEIRTEDPDVEITVKQGGKQVVILDGKTNQKHEVPVGDYEVELKGDKEGLRLSAHSFTLKQGDRKLVIVTRVPPKKAAPVGKAVETAAKPKVGEERVFEGHSDVVRKVVFSADGRQALSASFDKLLILWDVATGKEIRRFEGHTGVIDSAALSPDGRLALSSGDDKTVRVWDVATSKEQRQFEGDLGRVVTVTSSPDAKRALTGSWDRTMRLWNIDTGKELRSFVGHQDAVQSVAFSRDGKRAVSGSWDKTIRLWDLETGKELACFEGHTDKVHAVAYSPDGGRILSGGVDNSVRLWDVETRKELRRFDGHTDIVLETVFSPDGRRALSCSSDRSVRLWDLETGKELYRFDGHTAPVWTVAFSVDGQHALSGSQDKTMRLWRLPDPPKPASDHKVGEVRRFEGHTDIIWGLAVSSDGRHILSGSDDGTVRLWETATGKELRSLQGHSAPISGVSFSPDDQQALSASRDGTMRLWDLRTGKEKHSFEGHNDIVVGAYFTPDGRQALSSGGDKTLRLWDLASSKEVRRFEGHTDCLQFSSFSPDGKRLLSASFDKTIRLWEIATGKELRVFEGHGDNVRSVAYAPDGHHALSASSDGTVRLWDLDSGKEVRRLFENNQPVHWVSYSSDGRRALTAHHDGRIRLWDMESGRELRCFEGHTGPVGTVLFTPDGRHGVSASWDKTVRLWRLPDPPPPKPAFDHKPGQVHHIDWQDEQQGFPANVWWSRFTPDGSAFLVGGDSGPKGDIRLWDVATGRQLQQFATGGEPWYSGGLLLPSGKQLLSWYNKESELFLWDVATGKLVRKFEGPATDPLTVAVAPDGKRFLAGGNDKVIHLYDIQTGKELAKLEGHEDKCYGIFSPDSKQVLSYGPDKTLRLWDVEGGKLLHKLEGHADTCTGVFSPDGKQVLSYGSDKTVRMWEVATGKHVRTFEGPTEEVTFASHLPGGEKIVAWGRDRKVRVWEAGSAKLLLQFELGDKIGDWPNVALTPDGRRLVTGDDKNMVYVLEVATGKEIQRFEDAGQAKGFSFSPDGRYVAAGSFRTGVYLWRLQD